MTVEDYERIQAQDSDIRQHLPFLRHCAEGYDAPRIIELGVRTGRSTSAFLAGIGNGHLYSVDIHRPDVPQSWHDLGCWSFLQADDMSARAIMWLPLEVDILFIDTSHEYEHTVCELAVYGPRVREGGLILMHDTEYPHDSGVPTKAHDSAVGRALNWWAPRHGQLWENMPGCYGLGVVRVM